MYSKKQHKALVELDEYLNDATEEELKGDREAVKEYQDGVPTFNEYLKSLTPPEAERGDSNKP